MLRQLVGLNIGIFEAIFSAMPKANLEAVKSIAIESGKGLAVDG